MTTSESIVTTKNWFLAMYYQHLSRGYRSSMWLTPRIAVWGVIWYETRWEFVPIV